MYAYEAWLKKKIGFHTFIPAKNKLKESDRSDKTNDKVSDEESDESDRSENRSETNEITTSQF